MFLYKPKVISTTSSNEKEEIINSVSEEIYQRLYGRHLSSCSFRNKSIENSLYTLPQNEELELKYLLKKTDYFERKFKIKIQNETLFYLYNDSWYKTFFQIKRDEIIKQWEDVKEGEVIITSQRFVFVSNSCETKQNVYDIPLGVLFSLSSSSGYITIELNPFYSALYNETICFQASKSVCDIIATEINDIRFGIRFGQESATAFIQNTESFVYLFNFYKTNINHIGYDQELYYNPNSKYFKVYQNDNYDLCDTYPKNLIVPVKITDDIIKKCAEFRSKKRIPICTYFNQVTHGAIYRCSQPLVANSSYFIGVIKDSVSKEDQEFLSEIRTIGKNDDAILYIFDCRPVTNAYANRVNGGGYENTNAYKKTQLKFLNIPNIHTVVDCFIKMRNALFIRDTLTPLSYYRDTSEWLDLLFGLVSAIIDVVSLVQKGETILVHCSDGWDRTAQISSLCRLILSKGYRTTKGFCDLIYQEWISSGHQFQKRLHNKTNENSPIFLQFIEVTALFLRHSPQAFQFKEDLLVKIAEEATCPTTITFVRNCEKERSALSCDNYLEFFTQELKHYPTSFDSNKLEPIDLNFNVHEYVVWNKYYLRETKVIIH
ncbi:myotubularin, putative [Entamoeba histolytica HM-1:IMSS-B]|uniref:Myotubularin, putative n=4 Tax=Entamoeba histolytica TaxID=5759 RepID=C4M0I2_ENTH1|nr:myotubularin, putative [Entamoeba histolytica HM-1:IMSS]EAL45583.1 myotubularin, putative [Entamoeba histolytica HM-1:IMSS]EMD44989.1 myotubularin, putative [Entamoeba histolytica KU27]EMH75783.1 myotubularin, putative [Entamoeba histolytica HM-1:IMSS-B]ENY65008.1 myotubularin, putative [Entamoeba histolytica HM-1:IMSS-A]|eukprot:XP_650969.1 myotubularin, putative [Entamoeba histolytica HM-1:IMSS]